MMGHPFSEEQAVFVEPAANQIGRIYRKVIYREYTDASFATLKPREEAWEHLGLLGPVIHAEVGDTIRVVFRNNASKPHTVHPHGMFYDKANEGTPYADGTSGADKFDDGVPPGEDYTYNWQVPERAGPGPADPSSVGWLYHGHVDEPRDTNSGLVGAIIVTAAGMARPDGSPADVDREFVTLFTVFDENVSWLLDENVERFIEGPAPDPDDETFVEGNLMHAINGRVFANLDGLEMNRCERVRWYTFALGTEVDLHSPHWHANTGILYGRRVDVVELMPASGRVVDMQPDAPGIWMFHCHVNDHITAGMTALYTVRGEGGPGCAD
jgi:manganese oxidase